MFYGREDLMRQLNALWSKRVSSLVTCRGRRRVGKSTLIRRFAEKSHARFIKIEGERPDGGTTVETELTTFSEQLAAQTGSERTVPAGWLDAFIRLSREIRDDERTVVLIDEVSWLAFGEPRFANILRVAWENYLKPHDRLVLVVCGSVSGWIKDEIIDNGSYMGRRSLDVVVPELPLKECVKFWGKAVERWSVSDILDMLSVTGGVPRYLEELETSLSPDENIKRLCFMPNAVLRMDFDEMFTDVITREQKYTAEVLRCLVNGPRSVSEIAAMLGVEKSGRISAALMQLVEAGFVSPDAGKNPGTGADVRELRYRLKDNYARFYLKFVEPVKSVIDAGSYAFSGMDQFEGWETILGLQFENLVLNNYRDLLPLLHFERVLIHSAAPYYKPGTKGEKGAGLQVDLLLQSKMSYYVVEIKRWRTKIGQKVVEEMREKCRRLKRPSDVSLRTALVYAGDLTRSVEADGYFDAIVPASDLLGL